MKKVCVDNCLATLYPEIAAEWHPTKNGNITPKDVIAGSGKKYWFLCGRGHEWFANLYNRISGRGCPYCCNQKVCVDNCLATMYPEIAAEWHPTKNGNITPKDVVACSHKRYWFVCSNGHEWEVILRSRTLKKSNCSYCCNQKVYAGNCLATMYPKIAAEWHPTKNGNITPKDVIAGSNKKYYWKCSIADDHEWKTSPVKRISGRNCPCCSKPIRKLVKSNCLETTHPEIAAEWHPTKNGNITPRDVVAGSNKKCWFQCKKGHEWSVSPNGRTSGQGGTRGCPYCSHNILCVDNCLETCFPEIAAEWHPTKNGNITPKDVIAGSGKRYWFQCKYGHEWKTILANRSQGNGCPRCCESQGEKKLLKIAEDFLQRKLITKYVGQYKDPRIKNIRCLPFDIALFFGEKICVIEYQGKQHYQPINWSGKMTEEEMDRNLRRVQYCDKYKRLLCKKHDIKYLAIRYNQLKDMENIIMNYLGFIGLM